MRTITFLVLTFISYHSFSQLIIEDFRAQKAQKQNKYQKYQQNKTQKRKLYRKQKAYLEPEEYPRTELEYTVSNTRGLSENPQTNFPKNARLGTTQNNNWLYTGECGGAGGFPFEHVLPMNAQIKGFKVYRSERNPYLTGLEIYYHDARGARQIMLIGSKTRVVNSFGIPQGTRLVAISGQAGGFLNSIKFHLSDGNSSQKYGGNGGSRNYYMEIPNSAQVIGFYGSASEYIDRIGLIGEL